jgi:hypothetical protein
LNALRASLTAIGCAATVSLIGLSGCGKQSAGLIDLRAAHEIRKICAGRTDCNVRLNELMPGKWDSFYEFGPYEDQDDIDQVLGPSHVHASNMQRILVFSRDGKITKVHYSDFGVERPMDGEVVFDEEFRSSVPFWVKYSSDQVLRVTYCDTNNGVPFWRPGTGTYYLLTPVPLIPNQIPLCQRMF